MSFEAGSTECRGLIEAKESIIKAMNSLGSIENLDHIQRKLKCPMKLVVQNVED